jgi:anthraniloyl-CoA monooxygenase
MAGRVISIIGGGPAGLYAARLLKLRRPTWSVTVYERSARDEPFGFGVSLTGSALASFRAADEWTAHGITDLGVAAPSAEFRVPRGSVHIPEFSRGVAVARRDLLELLASACESAGVVLRRGRAADVRALRQESDIVVVADGAGSPSRAALRDELGAHEEFARDAFIWCAAEVPLTSAVFIPVATEHGVYATHSYPYTATRSGHVVEAATATIEAAGMSIGPRSDGGSDTVALDYLAEVFKELLDGRPLIGNRSVWGRFRWVRCDRWHHGNVVLIGDAAATAHMSLGSGTKHAMESAIALVDALAEGGSLDDAFARYQATQRPATDQLQDRSLRSSLWWQSIDHRLDLTPARLAVSYLTRAGAMSLDKLLGSAAELTTDAARAFGEPPPAGQGAEAFKDWLIHRPLRVRDGVVLGHRRIGEDGTDVVTVSGIDEIAAARSRTGASVVLVGLAAETPDPWGPAGDELVERAAAAVAAGADGVRLDGPSRRDTLLDRLAVAERVRTESRTVVAVVGPAEFRTDLVEGLLAGRLDLIELVHDTNPTTVPAHTPGSAS